MHQTAFHTLLSGSGVVKAPGVYDALSALLVQQAGFEACFFSGGSFSFARHGRPDMGLVSMQEVADAVAVIRERIDLPMIVDMDTGFGNSLNVARAVRVLERSGASALQLEDQVMPKRCGHMAGKEVISCAEMVGKIKAALDARCDEATALVARTDALGVHGFNDATDRAESYLEAGADLIFIEAPQNLPQMKTIAERFANRVPLVHNLVEGGHSPVTGADELEALGYRLALYPVALLHQFIPAAQQLLQHIASTGCTADAPMKLIDLTEVNKLLGADELLRSSRNYSGE